MDIQNFNQILKKSFRQRCWLFKAGNRYAMVKIDIRASCLGGNGASGQTPQNALNK
jgi:hypothetical protein